ncbi:MAG: S41 family peptidase [Sedimentisphaerales bacterium]|nr:S41 family peptidase [Sedimentisphaerales bacterium]
MKRTYLIKLSVLAAFLLLACYGFTAQTGNVIAVQSASITVGSESALLVDKICAEICEGDFAGARGLVKKSGNSTVAAINELANVISEYEQTEQKRHTALETAYKEQLAGFEKFKAEKDIDNINDTNDIVDALSVINSACEFADQKQKEKFLSDSVVQKVIQKAIDKAAELEVQGKWLEAYTDCYVWLMAIDRDNEGYSNYADQLLDKAAIAASFEDSPCETLEERFRGVEKEMFIKTIVFLNLYYVNVIDYVQMANKAVERCKLLGEVIGVSSRFDPDSLKSGAGSSNAEPFSPPDKMELATWSASLDALLDEVKLAGEDTLGFDKRLFIEVFEKVLKLNELTVNIPQPILIAQFSEAALSSLDPYTVIIWPKQVEDFEKMMTNEFTGIGIEISKPKGLLTVASLLPDTPAYKSGLDAGDIIQAVDGVKTKDMTLTCAVHKITGPKGTKVTLTIERPGEEKTKEITIIRDKIVVPTIRGWQRTDTGKWRYMIDEENKIGYVRLTSFAAESAVSLERVLLKLESQGLRGLILDLRSNSGGLLDSAVEVVDKFIEEGLIVKRQPGFGRMPISENASKKNTHPNYPLVILVNSGSASASEIVAGALADRKYKRAVLVGSRTHGKGSVQGITSYPGKGAQLKYTMAHYHLPSDQRVESREAMKKLGREDWGIGPNVVVELKSNEIKEMIQMQRDNDVLVQANHNNANNKQNKHTVKETLAADPQLAVGLLVVKSKLIQAEAPMLAQHN